MYDEINVLVLMPMDSNQKVQLIKALPYGNFIFASAQEVSNETIADAHVIIGNITPFRLNAAKNLKWLQLNTSGSDLYVKEGVLKKGTILTNATGAYGLAISEHMIGVLLSIFKKLHLYRDNQMKNEWKDEGEVKSIYGSTFLIIGLGDIGGEFAKKIKALGGYTIGVRRSDTSQPNYLDELYLMDKIDELLPRADVVALSLPNTKETYKMFDTERIARMKDEAVLINVGRGNCIDTEALCDALESEKLMGAALDVTDPEPLPKDHRLWTMKNAVITPHISGDFHLKETHNLIVRIAIDNLKAYVSGEEMRNLVDFSTGYKSKTSK